MVYKLSALSVFSQGSHYQLSFDEIQEERNETEQKKMLNYGRRWKIFKTFLPKRLL